MNNNIAIYPAKRDSNLELFRCITMLLIVAHHYVVNSGLLSLESPVWNKPTSWQTIFLLDFGAFGKTGINCFLLITGYYMCKSSITPRKYFRLLAQIYFYRIIIQTSVQECTSWPHFKYWLYCFVHYFTALST